MGTHTTHTHTKSWDLVNQAKTTKKDNLKSKCRGSQSKPTSTKPPNPKKPRNPKRKSSRSKTSKYPKPRRKRGENPKLSRRGASTSREETESASSDNRRTSASENLCKANGSMTSISRRDIKSGTMRSLKSIRLIPGMRDLTTRKDTSCDMATSITHCLYFC